jgi:mannose-1-phosphate guanylyltransferase
MMPFSPWRDFVVRPLDHALQTEAEPRPSREERIDGVCGIVLAGSHHWGDGAFERVLRGPLLPVAQTPLICYSLEWLQGGGVREAVLCANSSTSDVRDYLGDGASLGVALEYFEDHEPRGPAGCALDASRLSEAETFVVVEGTLVPSLDLVELLRTHRASGAGATIVVEVDRRGGGDGRGRPRLPGGIYVFERRVLEGIAPRGYQDIKQGLLERLHTAGEHVAMHEVQGLSPRVLDYGTYTSVSRWLITRAIKRPTFLADYVRVGDGLHHPTAVVHPTARLVGPVLLGPGARVEAGAVLVGPTSVGAGSVVGAGALVSRALVWDGCTIGEAAIVDASMLADHSRVRAAERVYGAVQIQDEVIAPRPLPERVAARPAVVAPAPRPSAPIYHMPPRTSQPVQLPAGFALRFAAASDRRVGSGEHTAIA